MRKPPSYPKCGQMLEQPQEIPDGLPGIKYRVCYGCGYSAAVTTKPKREKLP